MDYSERGFHKFQSDFFLKVASFLANWREIIIDVIKKMTQHNFFELFGWNIKAPFTFAIILTEVLMKVIFSSFWLYYIYFYFLNQVPTVLKADRYDIQLLMLKKEPLGLKMIYDVFHLKRSQLCLLQGSHHGSMATRVWTQNITLLV